MKEAIAQLQRQGVIRESNSLWASPIVLVRKKNGKIRPCVDYRKVNQASKKDAYPIPRTQDCLEAMAGSVIFSTLDMTSGYYQVAIKEEDIPKTAFATRHGLWEFVAMPFGLTNAPATFQRLMELAMRGLQWTSCLIYLDDVIIYGRTFQEHTERLQQVLDRIRSANLKLKPEKCELFQEQVRFLGHIVCKKGVQPDPTNINKVTGWPPLRTVTEVRQFLGLCSYHRRFVKNFSVIARPLSSLTAKDRAGVDFRVPRSLRSTEGELDWSGCHGIPSRHRPIYSGHRRLRHRNRSCAFPNTRRTGEGDSLCQPLTEQSRKKLLRDGQGTSRCEVLHRILLLLPPWENFLHSH